MAMFTSKAGGYGRPRYRRHNRRIGFISLSGAAFVMGLRRAAKARKAA